MKCVNCNCVVPGSASVCPYCGNRLYIPNDRTIPVRTEVYSRQRHSRSPKNNDYYQYSAFTDRVVQQGNSFEIELTPEITMALVLFVGCSLIVILLLLLLLVI